MRAVATLLAVLAAAGNATASVLERRVNREQPDRVALRWELVARLVRQPLWLAAMGAVTASFLLQAAALSFGQLSMVQPLLVLELPLTLVIAARAFGNDLGAREWSAVAAMTAGLGGLIYAAAPRSGSTTQLGAVDWVVGIGAVAAAMGLLVVVGVRARGDRSAGRRATAYGLAAGIGFGMTAALMKAMDHAFSNGVTGALEAWQTYAMVVAGAGSMFLVQNAFQAGRLVAAQPALTLSDPVVAIVWGAALYGEHLRTGPWLALELAGAAGIAWGVVRLAGSPAASAREDRDQRDRTPSNRARAA